MSEFIIRSTDISLNFETVKDYSDREEALRITTYFMQHGDWQNHSINLSYIELKILQDMLTTSLKNYEKHNE